MFKTFRSKLISSYVVIIILLLLVALVGTLALARVYSEQADFNTLKEKSALVLPFVQLELTNPRRPLPQALLQRMQTSIRLSRVRVLFVDPQTMKVEQDTSMRFNAVGERFAVDDLDPNIERLYSQEGVQGKFTLPGENVTFLYVAYRVRGIVQSSDSATQRDAAATRQLLQNAPGNVIVVFAQSERGLRELAGDLVNYFGLAALLALLLALAASLWLARSISRPVARLAAGAQAIARGDYSQQLPVEGHDELSTLTRRFNEMAAEVSRAHQMERDFVANVSHDLKTPLTSIQGFSQAMLDGAISDEADYRQAASIINGEAQRMSRLVSELLSLSKLQNQLNSMDKRALNFDTLLSQLVLAMQPQARNAGVELKLDGEMPGTWVIADADRLKQAFGNLIDNAIKYTPPGGTVRIALQPSPPGSLVVSIQDTGHGIPEEDLPRVTERFYQVDKSRSRADGKSAGLGLAIAQEIIRAHGGEVLITSREGWGTTVNITLPLPAGHSETVERGNLLRRFGQSARRAQPPSTLPGPPTPPPNGSTPATVAAPQSEPTLDG